MRRSVARWNAAFMRHNGLPEEICPAQPPRPTTQCGLHCPPEEQTLESYIAEVSAKAKRGELQNVRAAMRTNPKVLLVDDDESLAASLQRALEVTGYAVQTTDRAEQGLVTARQEDFDVVVTDLRMAGSSGLDVIESLHSTNPHL